MTAENQARESQKGRWLRVAFLAYTLVGPSVNALLERLRQRSQSKGEPVQVKQDDAQPDVRQRLDELTLESSRWVNEQVQQLRTRARELSKQSRQLRKALRREARQRRKLVTQVRKSGVDRGRDLLKRGEQLTGELKERGGKITHDLLDLGGKTAQDLVERSGEFTQDLAERGGKVTQELAKRGRKATHDLAERGESLLQPVRERDRNFWSIVGFSVGLVAAGVVTYRLVRRRVIQQELEQVEQIELQPSESWNGAQGRPAGEILHLGEDGTIIATLQAVDVDSAGRPAGATHVGIVSTKQYYPVEVQLEPGDIELVYFVSEEEARARGFTPAQ
jgi:hypothetical protein